MYKTFVSFVILILTGCSSVGNLTTDRAVYGGVQLSTKEIGICYRQTFGPYATSGPDVRDAAAYQLAFHLVDLPLTVFADTVTLPITIPSTIFSTDHGKEKSASVQAIDVPSHPLIPDEGR